MRLELAKEESKGQGSRPLHEDIFASLLIWQGLDLEEQQYVLSFQLLHPGPVLTLLCQRRRLCADINGIGQHATDNQRAALLERGNRIRRKIEAWSEIQHLYMPSVASLRAKVDREGRGKPQDATTLELFLPSQILSLVECDDQLYSFEWHLHFAQAHDALNDIRRLLVLCSRLHCSKEHFARGQFHNTRGVTVLNRINDRIHFHAKKYRETRILLEWLAPRVMLVSWDLQLKVLQDEDIRALEEGDEGSSTEGQRVLSWIWRIPGANSNKATQEGTCIELSPVAC